MNFTYLPSGAAVIIPTTLQLIFFILLLLLMFWAGRRAEYTHMKKYHMKEVKDELFDLSEAENKKLREENSSLREELEEYKKIDAGIRYLLRKKEKRNEN